MKAEEGGVLLLLVVNETVVMLNEFVISSKGKERRGQRGPCLFLFH